MRETLSISRANLAATLARAELDSDSDIPESDVDDVDSDQENKKKKKIAKRGRPQKKESHPPAPASSATSNEKRKADINANFNEAFVAKKGQKNLVKELLNRLEDVVEFATPSNLRRAFWEANFTNIPDGRKLCTRIIEKLTPYETRCIIHKRMIYPAERITDAQLNDFGQIVLDAWFLAKKDDKPDLMKSIEEDLINVFFHHAIIMKPPMDMKFYKMLAPFHQYATKSKIDDLVFRCSRPSIWQYLDSPNNQVRYMASLIMLDFYPIMPSDIQHRFTYTDKQHEYLQTILTDECRIIRQECIPKIIKILQKFADYIPVDAQKAMIIKLVDELSYDNDLGTRSAVFGSLRYFLYKSTHLTVTEHILKCTMPRGISDKSEEIRLHSVKLLNALKEFRYISIMNVIHPDKLFERLGVETSEAVKKELVKLCCSGVLPAGDELKENFSSIRFLLHKGRRGAMAVYQMAYGNGVMDLAAAMKHFSFMVHFFQARAREISGVNLADPDETAASANVAVNRNPIDETSDKWKKFKLLLDCIILFAYSMMPDIQKDDLQNHKMTKLLGYVFNKTCSCFMNTSAIGSVLTIATILPTTNFESCANQEHKDQVMDLIHEDVGPESVGAYVEAIAHWRLDEIFKAITRGLKRLEEYTSDPAHSPQIKKHKQRRSDSLDLPANSMAQKSLRFLKHILSSFRTREKIIASHCAELEGFYKLLSTSIPAIQHELSRTSLAFASTSSSPTPNAPTSSKAGRVIELDTLLMAYQVKQCVCTLIMISCLNDNTDERKEHAATYLKDAVNDLRWFSTEVLPSLEQLSDNEEMLDFIVKMSVDVLRTIELTLESLDFSLIESSSRAASFADDGMDDSHNPLDYCSAAIFVLKSFASSSTPSSLMLPVISGMKGLLAYSSDHLPLALQVFHFIPKWVTEREKYEDELNVKEISDTISSFIKIIRTFEGPRIDHTTEYHRQVFFSLSKRLANEMDEHREILDPRRHDYEMSQSVDILLIKTLIKQESLISPFLDMLGSQTCSLKYLPADQAGAIDVVRLAIIAQIAAICTMFCTRKKNRDAATSVLSAVRVALAHVEQEKSDTIGSMENVNALKEIVEEIKTATNSVASAEDVSQEI